MVLLELPHQRHDRRRPPLQQQRKYVQFFVFMVQRRSDVEVTQHVAGRLAGGLVHRLLTQVGAQPRQQGQGALNALVASLQHRKGLLEPYGWGVESG